MIYQWLPGGHNWTKCYLEIDQCMCYGAKDETFEHLLSCDHEDLKEIRKTAYLAIQKTCDGGKLLLNSVHVFLQVIHSVLEAEELPATLNIPDAISAVIAAQ